MKGDNEGRVLSTDVFILLSIVNIITIVIVIFVHLFLLFSPQTFPSHLYVPGQRKSISFAFINA